MIDFHCHLDLFPDPAEGIEAYDRGEHYVLSVTTAPKAFAKTASLARKSKRIRTALGLHPQVAHERLSELSLFDRLINETDYVGEVGLDGGKEYAQHFDKQVVAFNHILGACQSVGGRMLSIHSRHAASKVLDCLEAYPDAGVPILHWFSGSPSELRRAIAVGCWFSVGRPMTKSAKGVEHLKSMPRDRILTETDAPFASAPTDVFRDLETTVKALADAWACSSDEAADQLKSNLRHLAAK